MHITVFGATGPAGKLVIRRALDQGHRVTAYARNPAKLDELPGLHVVVGELDDAAAVRTAVTGADAVISLLGPGRDKASIAPLVPGMQTIIDQMTEAGTRRLVTTSTPSAPDPADRRDLRIKALVTGIRYGAGPAYRAIVAMAEVVRASTLDWTIVRLPLLHDKPLDAPARARQIGDSGGLRLSRTSLADFLIGEAEDATWVCQAPILADR
ncbi:MULTISPECIES: NAD(P)H-binding protein [unclassified Nocardioides]|uniref:NAD(P)-dependent oxidoreductase n=1 Tax=unclassified Nocardioides TaxID=2615069 RepID=UPI00005702AC|nr:MULTISPECIES: NAD(P)H-binding protein [unclassified Nocardioides]ABL81698.1 NmrA family protein [Nocardioides sp. JS614]